MRNDVCKAAPYGARPRHEALPSDRVEQLQIRRSLRRVFLYREGVPTELVVSLWANPDAVVDRGSVLVSKRSVRTTVAIESGDRRYVLKRYQLRSYRHAAKDAFRRSKAHRCWLTTDRLRAAGVRTPRPVALVEERLGPIVGRSYYVYEYVEGVTLREWLDDGDKPAFLVDRFAGQMKRLWDTLGELRVTHPDMNLGNFVIDRDQQLWAIDLDNLRWHWSNRAFRSVQAKRRRALLRRFYEYSSVHSLRTSSGDRLVEFLERHLLS